ncbi:UDP-2,3-diacylglucosamine diphosphatase [Herminiimonas aquatilis]|uniref:UDP-2,3-diacylglucosamine hydrolase n=1 Tax=Herminiimonas aquatilis TaxID=345342 RepID=A0ABW2J7J8_9BURK
MTISSSASNKQAQPLQAALFVSDLHLQAAMPRTTEAFFNFLHTQATKTQRLYLLGDIFEAWAGDDDIPDAYNQQVVTELRNLSDRGIEVFWIAGNRDFLVGEQFAKSCNLTLLPDPFVTTIADRLLVLTHGDAYCTDDAAYMQFRAQVRDAEWQRNFLNLPLIQRKAIIENLRAGSRAAQRDKSYDIMDVNNEAIAGLFAQTATAIMIHGHTHRPARHDYQANGKTRVRYVLSDWDLDGAEPRGDWLALDTTGTIRRFDLYGVEIGN